ncbi:unnamed protein product [Sympodiomycopsis kandeliae]
MFQWLHKIGPGFVILLSTATYFISFLLQLLVTIGLPTIRSIYFLDFTLADLGQEIKIGIWTICTTQPFDTLLYSSASDETCQPTTLGYDNSQYGPIADYLFIHSLAKALVVQPISTAFAAIAILTSIFHICSNFIVWPFVGLLATILTLLSFLFEIILFSVARVRLNQNDAVNSLGQGVDDISFGPAFWIQLAAVIVILFAMFAQWTAYKRRKSRKTHTIGVTGRNNNRDSASIRSYRARTNVENGTPPTSTKKKRQSSSYAGSHSDNIALKDMAAPTGQAASPVARTTMLGEPINYGARRKRVPKYTEDEDDTAAAADVAQPRKSSISERQDAFEDADDHIDESAQSPSAESSLQHHDEPLQELQNTIVSPRRGKRSARYSARMAED